jgi:hypothetical protein
VRRAKVCGFFVEETGNRPRLSLWRRCVNSRRQGVASEDFDAVGKEEKTADTSLLPLSPSELHRTFFRRNRNDVEREEDAPVLRNRRSVVANTVPTIPARTTSPVPSFPFPPAVASTMLPSRSAAKDPLQAALALQRRHRRVD